VYSEGISDISVTLNSARRVGMGATPARARRWEEAGKDDKVSSELMSVSVSDSVSESGSRRADGRPVT